jgi:uncharacterized protein involved in oxidation of intracellular sulfur
MRYLFTVNDCEYGNQRAYNGLRLAAALSRKAPVRVFLLGDGVVCGIAGFAPAHADYNPQELLRSMAATGTAIGVCGTCMDARGIPPGTLIREVRRSNMEELAAWTEESDKVISF